MPLPEGLLNPFTGENPSGQSLRYDPVYDKIREARRADEELQLSEEASKRDVWTRAVKKADFVQVSKLCTEVLAKRAKDLQIAAWLTEALLAQEKIPGLTQGLDLIRGLLENFWDTVHPEIEDGDLEMRVGPVAWVGAAVDSVQSLEARCDAKFGGSAPNFANLKKALEDLQDSVREFWKPAEKEAAPEVAPEDSLESVSGQETGAAAPPARKRVSAAEQPADPDDAVRGMVALARYLRLANPASPVPYMVLRALRWGELRANASSLDSALLDSPPRETRQLLKKLASESQWTELLDGAETAMSLPCGRGWLDLQRYSVRACEGMGYDSVAAAIRAELRSLLSDYPDLSSASLSDDTPAANNETQAWIHESILPPPPAPPEPEIAVAPPGAARGNGAATPDVNERAQQAMRAGRIQEALELLSGEIAQERSGRGRFYRKVQLAALCLSAKREAIAYPILAELAEEIERRKLEEWEESSALANSLTLLFRCMDKLGYDEAAKQKVYQKICRLDPVQVLAAMR